MKIISKKELVKRNPYSKRPVDINENSSEYIISIAIPEYNQDNISARVKGELLHIVINKKKMLGQGSEKVYERYFKLPHNINSKLISARVVDSILYVRIPKSTLNPNRII